MHLVGLRGREREVTEEIERRTGQRTSGFYMPSHGWGNLKQRAYKVGTGSLGGDLLLLQKQKSSLMLLEISLRLVSLKEQWKDFKGNIEIPKRDTGEPLTLLRVMVTTQ